MSNIPGKDRGLEESLDKLKTFFKNIGFHLQEKKLINPAPGLWSVHLEDPDSKLYSNGKGGSSLACLVSAYAEFLERLGTGFFLADYPHFEGYSIAYNEEVHSLGDFTLDQCLNKKLWSYYDPHHLLEPKDLIDPVWDGAPRISLLPMLDGDGHSVKVPTSLLKELYVSNGLSIGNSSLEAKVQALSEIFERYVRFEILKNGYSLPEFPIDELRKWVSWDDISSSFDSHGYELRVLDSSLGKGYPVVCVVLIHKSTGKIMLSFGAHPNPAVAVERTLTELMQGRDFENLDDLVWPHSDQEACSDPVNLESHFINSVGLVPYSFFNTNTSFEFEQWGVVGSREEEWNYLRSCLGDHSVLYWEQDIDVFTLIRMVVPGMSEIYPVEDLWDTIREERLSLRSFMAEPKKGLLSWGLLPFHPDDRVSDVTNLPLEACGQWAYLTFGELRLIADFYEGDTPSLELETMDFTSADNVIGTFFTILKASLSVDSSILEELFPSGLIAQVRALVEQGSWPSDLLPPLGRTYNLSRLHGVNRMRQKITSYWQARI